MQIGKVTPASGITINIYTESVPLASVDKKPESISVSTDVPKTKVDKDVERGDALDIELLTRDSMADDEKLELEQRVVLFVREMLQEKKSSVIRNFLDKAKYHLDPALKESISDEITALKKDL